MAFCSNCGSQLTPNQKFCAQCGTDNSKTPGVAAAPPPAAPSIPAQPVQPVQTIPPQGQYPPPGAIPVAVPVPPPPQPAQKKGMTGIVVAVVLIAGIGYYYYKTHPTPTPTPTPAPAPAPGPAPTPASDPSGNAALVKLQVFNAHWQDQSGMLNLTTATWQNNSNTNITSATLQCRQYNAAGTDLSEYRVTLNGPTNAGTTSNFSNIGIGATAPGMTKVDCDIVHVKP